MTVWSKENTSKAKKMWEQGYSPYQIAMEIGTTRNAVIGKAINKFQPLISRKGKKK